MVEDIINPDKREVESREQKKSETRSRDEMFADGVDLKCDMLDVVLASMGKASKAHDLDSMEVQYGLLEDYVKKALKEIDGYNNISYELNNSKERLREALNYLQSAASSGKLGCNIKYSVSLKESDIYFAHANKCFGEFRRIYNDYWLNK